ncbi:hypothetical protein H112_01874 [Trichophyton rubrum D6]|uniref:Uncharacterized protein n=1 Tax=Trichophyton rubrum CBS 288.86 TaxID=1215330 RepID=A0A022WBM4_TRIRU|nr:hypothetical protein H100_01870 [Trichophyton rubrum MR850]EZF44836.1 hypothetical protein H102_01868 [Trichophyton rubrum CBS 100081]EZF55488.1 hypothetical protein H103_01879 [Trichophyton rubrum CBS 288.86]EZF66068.1 hypothetical protein H104_01853 [Trichophyton rubrum CBS 289.86]EZF87522.1 hypothetical protein H110_01877 [Trichophyton rubrum MR1448]EZG19853.1 hypothetical protein H107_01935 [Trichophyton rubrum CBS 202.88]KDB36643.1 hypothetical protein H112_01874 [Trichophyton rubrum 
MRLSAENGADARIEAPGLVSLDQPQQQQQQQQQDEAQDDAESERPDSSSSSSKARVTHQDRVESTQSNCCFSLLRLRDMRDDGGHSHKPQGEATAAKREKLLLASLAGAESR